MERDKAIEAPVIEIRTLGRDDSTRYHDPRMLWMYSESMQNHDIRDATVMGEVDGKRNTAAAEVSLTYRHAEKSASSRHPRQLPDRLLIRKPYISLVLNAVLI